MENEASELNPLSQAGQLFHDACRSMGYSLSCTDPDRWMGQCGRANRVEFLQRPLCAFWYRQREKGRWEPYSPQLFYLLVEHHGICLFSRKVLFTVSGANGGTERKEAASHDLSTPLRQRSYCTAFSTICPWGSCLTFLASVSSPVKPGHWKSYVGSMSLSWY